MSMKLFLQSIFIVLTLIWLMAQTSFAQTTAFNYQGSLRDGGNAANGSFQMQFKLFDSLGGGAQIGSTITDVPVTATDGVFSAKLDFGSNALNGSNRWLEIAVRHNSGEGYTTLTPREQIASAPYSVRTLSAASADTATNALNLGGVAANQYLQTNGNGSGLTNLNAGSVTTGTLSNSRLGQIPTANIADSAITAPKIAGGQVVKSVNTLKDDVTLAAGSNITITPAGNTLTVASTGLTLPFSGSGSAGIGSAVFKVTNTASGYGLWGQNSGSNGVGIFGDATASGGAGVGVYGQSSGSYGVYGSATAPSGFTFGGSFQNSSTDGSGVYGSANAGTGVTNGGRFESGSTSGRGVYGAALAGSGSTYGGYFLNNSPSGRAVYGIAAAASGTAQGVYGISNSTSGIGTVGYATAGSGTTYGVYGQSDSPAGSGVYGSANAGIGVSGVTNGATFVAGVYGVASATGPGSLANGGLFVTGSEIGSGVRGVGSHTTGINYGGYFQSVSTNGTGVFSLASAPTGHTFGVYGVSNSTGGEGIFGYASASSGSALAVHGLVVSPSGRAVLGEATATSGDARGVYGISNSTAGLGTVGYATAGSGTTYGVYGQADSPSGYGLWASGRTGASGTKSFRIDHPDDPTNKYLMHYSSESPEVINFYRGTVILNDAGEAMVELPSYFAKINTMPSYQLTAVGTPMPLLHIAAEIDEAALIVGAQAGPGAKAPVCSFRIAGGTPGGKVSWRVEAVRNDLWVRERGAPVEVEKQDREKGTYQHPDLYGQPAQKGLNYDATRERPKPVRP